MTGGLRKTLFFALVLGVIICGWLFMIKPANESLTVQKQRVRTKLLKLAKLEKTASAAEDLRIQLQQLQKAIDTLESKLPPTSQIGRVLEQITVIAQKQNLTAKSIRTSKKKNKNGYVEQPLKMELEGDFDSFYSFLLELEQLSRIMKVRHLDLRKLRAGTAALEGQVSAKFVVSIFFQAS